MIPFCQNEISTRPAGTDPTLQNMGNEFSSRQGGTNFYMVFVYKNPWIPIDLKMFTKS